MASPLTSIRDWLDERFHLDDIKALVAEEEGARSPLFILVLPGRHDAVSLRSAGLSPERCC